MNAPLLLMMRETNALKLLPTDQTPSKAFTCLVRFMYHANKHKMKADTAFSCVGYVTVDVPT